MKKSKITLSKLHLVLLIVLIIGTFSLRLAFAVNTENFSYNAYLPIRLINQVADHASLFRHDSLSFGGRLLLVSPLFYYIMAALSWLGPNELVLKTAPQLFISILPFLSFLIVHEITKKSEAALFSAALTAFVPILFSETLFSLSPIILALPLTFTATYLLSKIPRRSAVISFVITILALALVHHSSILLIASLGGYLIISLLEKMRIPKAELEIIFFSAFIYLWIQFLFYKEAFLSHGIALIRQNIPMEIIHDYFVAIPLIGVLIAVGFIPALVGLYSIYKYLLKVKNKYIHMYISISIISALFVWMRIIQPSVGLMYLGVCLSILSGPAYVRMDKYFQRTRVKNSKMLIRIGMIVLIVVFMVMPSIYSAQTQRNATVSQPIYDGMDWLNRKSPSTSTVLAVIKEGHLVTAIANRKNVVDNFFIVVPDPDRRVRDVRRIYTAPFSTETVELLTEYDVDYIVVTDNTRLQFDIEDLSYKGLACLKQIYDRDGVIIYRSQCKLEVTG
jgi:hypothetical protein